MNSVGVARPGRRVVPSAVVAVCVTGYLATAAVRLPSFLGGLQRNSDAVAPGAIATGRGLLEVGNVVSVSEHTWLDALWFDQLTGWVPGHRLIWIAGGLWIYLAGTLVLAAALRRLAGSRATVLAMSAVVCMPPAVLWAVAPQTFHAESAFVCMVLPVALVIWPRSSSRRIVSSLVMFMAVMVTGLFVASDGSAVIQGVVPALVCAIVTPALARGRHARRCGGRLALFAVGALLAAGTMTGLAVLDGVRVHPIHTASVSAASWWALPAALGRLVTGSLHFEARDAWTAVLSCAALVALAVPLTAVARQARSPERDPRRLAWVVYWALVEVATVVGLPLSGSARDQAAFRFLVPAVIAVAATAPFLGSVGPWRSPRLATTAAATAILVNTMTLAAFRADTFAAAMASPDLDGVVRLAAHLDIHRGYASYWNAMTLTWLSRGHLRVSAVAQGAACTGSAPHRICPDGLYTVSGWLRPARGPVMLVMSPGTDCLTVDPTSVIGPPAARYRVGSTSVLVYRDDVEPHFTAGAGKSCTP